MRPTRDTEAQTLCSRHRALRCRRPAMNCSIFAKRARPASGSPDGRTTRQNAPDSNGCSNDGSRELRARRSPLLTARRDRLPHARKAKPTVSPPPGSISRLNSATVSRLRIAADSCVGRGRPLLKVQRSLPTTKPALPTPAYLALELRFARPIAYRILLCCRVRGEPAA